MSIGIFREIKKGTSGTVTAAGFLGTCDVRFTGARVVRGLRSDQVRGIHNAAYADCLISLTCLEDEGDGRATGTAGRGLGPASPAVYGWGEVSPVTCPSSAL
jgi:hypothetical protein